MKPAVSRSQLLWLQATQSFAIQLTMSVLYPFLRARFSFAELSLQSLVQYSLPIILLPFIRAFWVRRFVLFAFAVSVVRMLFLARVTTPLELYVAAALAGCMLVFFWVPYEITYFRERTRNGISSAWYFGVMSVAGVIAPILAGVIADRFGYRALFLLAAIIMLVPLVLARRLPDEPIRETLGASLRSLKKIRPLLVFDGFLLSTSMCLTGLSLLTLTKTATAFGTVSGLATLAATIVSFTAAQLSDRHGNRSSWITWTSVASAALILALGWQTSFWWFSLVLVAYTCVRTLAQPIINALPMDLHPDHTKLYIGRQFLISAGRVVGFALTWACAMSLGLRPMYVIYALAFVVYIFYVRKALASHDKLDATS